MLVLQRKKEESIVLSHPALPGDVTVSILAIQPHRIKIGVTGPRSVNIARDELLLRKAGQGEETIPEIFQHADREEARSGLSLLTLTYVERLEKITRLADMLWDALAIKAQSPEEHLMLSQLLIELVSVNFLSDEAQKQEESGELPREVIFK